MRLRFITLALLGAVAFGGCAVKGDLNKSTVALDRAFTDRLLDRLRLYQTGAADLDARVRQAPPPATPPGNASPGPPDNAVAKLFYGSFELHARADVLDHFLHEAAMSGRGDLMMSWVQDKSARLATSVAMTDAISAQFRADAVANPADPSLSRRYFDLLQRRATERGIREELATLGADAAGYRQDYRGGAPTGLPLLPPPPLL